MKDMWGELILTIMAILVGLILAKQIAKVLSSYGVRISSGNPLGISVNGEIMKDKQAITATGDFGPWYGGAGS